VTLAEDEDVAVGRVWLGGVDAQDREIQGREDLHQRHRPTEVAARLAGAHVDDVLADAVGAARERRDVHCGRGFDGDSGLLPAAWRSCRSA
jgi:hypothetical protein